MLFPLAEYWWFYAVFTAFVLVLLAVDLGVFHRKDYEITIREAAKFSAIWISMAMLFNVLLYYYAQSAFAQDPRLLATIQDRAKFALANLCHQGQAVRRALVQAELLRSHSHTELAH